MALKKIVIDKLLAGDKHFNVNLINCLSGPNAPHLIGTKGDLENLAIFNTVIHIGSKPPLLGFILRPTTVPRDTYSNLLDSGFFTINSVNKHTAKKAHFTSFKHEGSEFEAVNLTPVYKDGFQAPYCDESSIQIGLKFQEEKELKNGCRLITGEIKQLYISEQALKENGRIDVAQLNLVGALGLNTYYEFTNPQEYPFPTKDNLPKFRKEHSSERIDNVVFDEEKDKYVASMMKYSTNIGAPAIQSTDMSTFKSIGTNKVNHLVKFKFENLKKDFQDLMELYKWNEIIYSSKFDFEPIIGQKYHLYEGKNGQNFLSQIPPHEWSKKNIGSFLFDEDRIFRKL